MINTSPVKFMMNDLLCHLGSGSLISLLDKTSIALISKKICLEAVAIQVQLCRDRNVQCHGSWQ